MKPFEPSWVHIFLHELRRTGTIAAACQKAGISAAMPYRQSERHPEFRIAFEAVVAELEEKPHPGPRRMREDHSWHNAFLDALRAGQTVEDAATSAGISSTAAYKHRHRLPQFRATWDAIMQQQPEPAWVRIFLETLRQTGTIAAACRKAGISSGLPYKRAKSSSSFQEAWDAVKTELEERPPQ